MFSCEFFEISKNIFFHRTSPWLFLSCRFKSGLNRVISGLIAYQVVNSIDWVIIRWQKGRKQLPSSSKFLVPQKIRFFSGNVFCVINICNLKENLFAWHLLLFLIFFIFPISAQVQLSAQSKKPPTQKLLFLNECPGHLIGHLR